MFIDTHCHLSKKYYDHIDQVINENKKQGMDKMIVSGCSREEIEEVIDYIHQYESVFATIGYHPEEAALVNKDDLQYLEDLLIHHSKIIGIGEIGLDYHYPNVNKKLQLELFKHQLEIAERLKMPVIIHSRDATMDTINTLKEFHVSGIIHCFSGSLEVAREYISMNFKLGIGGVVTFKNSNLYQVIKEISLKDIVLETDSPYLTPHPFRGKQNSSKYIPYIAQKLAQIKNVEVDEIYQATTQNCIDLFDFNL